MPVHQGSECCVDVTVPNIRVLVIALYEQYRPESAWRQADDFGSDGISRHGFSCLAPGSVSTLVCLVLAHVSSFHVSSCLMFLDCILTISLSDIAKCLLWSPYGIGQTIIFSSCCFFVCFFLLFFPCLILAVAHWMSTIFAHMVWP